jgi:hypothetical protein
MLAKATAEGIPAKMRDRIDRLAQYVIGFIERLYLTNASTWMSTVEQARSIASRNYFTRFVGRDVDTQAIAGHISTISWSIESFTVSCTLVLS